MTKLIRVKKYLFNTFKIYKHFSKTRIILRKMPSEKDHYRNKGI